MNALANNQVGKYLNTYFVASYQKVGTFRIVDGKKQGGNLASYFCTPGGQVLHALAGPVSAAVMLREARWVIETHKLAMLEGQDAPDRLNAFFGKAHADRLWQEYSMRVDDPGRLPFRKVDGVVTVRARYRHIWREGESFAANSREVSRSGGSETHSREVCRSKSLRKTRTT